jgi:RNA-binding protein
MHTSLSSQQKRYLRGLGHHLKPIVMIGQHGLRPAVMTEIEQALDAHELVKIKIAAGRDARDAVAAQIMDQTGAEAIQAIGQMRVIFRRNPKAPRIALPSE